MTAAPSLLASLLKRLLPVMLAAMLISGGLSYVGAQYYVNQVFDRVLIDTLNGISSRILIKDQRIVFDFPEAAQKIFEWDIDDAAYFRIESLKKGHVAGQTDLEPSLGPISAQPSPAVVKDSVYRQRRIRVAVKTLTLAGASDQVRVIVAETTISRDRMTQEVAFTVLAAELLLIALAVLVVWISMRRAIAPISEAARDLEKRTHHTQELLDDSQVPQEIRPLTAALNDLLTRLQQALTLQRQFVADAAHQLRTPLTALKLHLENAQSINKTSEVAAMLDQIQIASDRATRLAQQLLTLAESEEQLLRGDRSPINLRSLLNETVQLWQPQAERKSISMALSFEPKDQEMTMLGHPDLLIQVMNNLIDNALRYCPFESSLHLHARQSEHGIQISVEDNGPGIAAPERPLVVRRFYRGDQSPNAKPEQVAGSGLGLAIAFEIMTRLGGKFEIVDPTSGRGTRIELILPIA
ncbi:MAG: sensor histidine kinase N-terminal domain-containing protein [Betaproteobacteria bacterium]|jgi:two-component system sensor histidine kinase TctE